MIYLKSFLTGLVTLFAAVFLVGIVLIASEFVVAFGYSQIAAVLVVSFLVFAAGFSWQYRRLSRKG